MSAIMPRIDPTYGAVYGRAGEEQVRGGYESGYEVGTAAWDVWKRLVEKGSPTIYPPKVVDQEAVAVVGRVVIDHANDFDLGFPETIIPEAVGYQAVQELMANFTFAPASLREYVSLFGSGIGTMLVMAGSRMLAAIPMIIEAGVIAKHIKFFTDKGVQIRQRTSAGPGKGRYQRLRPPSGAFAHDEADPYDEPCGWIEFWCWLT